MNLLYSITFNNIQATISAFLLVKNMSIYPKSVQYFKLGQTKWQTKFKARLNLFTYISIQLPHNEAKCKAPQQLLN